MLKVISLLNLMHCRGEEDFIRRIPIRTPQRGREVKRSSATNYSRFVAVTPSLEARRLHEAVLKNLSLQPATAQLHLTRNRR